MNTTTQERQEAKDRLKEWIKDGDTVYTVLRHKAQSGMTRIIDLVKFHPDDYPLYMSFNASKVLGWSFDKKYEGVRVKGCGMDMGYHLVSELGHCLGINLKQRWI